MTERAPSPLVIRGHRTASNRNWPLALGLLLLSLIIFLAVVGPALAPRDPLETNTVVKIGAEWVRLPYPPFTVPGFPLGSDTYGRDLLSRLLWGVRPTMILVTLVALIRLVVGVAIGMAAGWSTHGIGRALEALISAALAVPAIITALAAITAVGIQHGLPAFLLGLALTGWAETARLVSEQTRGLKSLPFVEAARAMGASGPEIVLRHVLRQITPLLGMLLAFEAGATLMMVAALGFLGYYLGGAFWIEITDFSARAISGLPELGQMLANSWQVFKPWATVATGTVVFLSILGFNLVGEGLRRRLSLMALSRRSAVSEALGRGGAWIVETLLAPDTSMARRRRFAGILAGITIIGLAAWWWRPWHTSSQMQNSAQARAALPIPGNHLWAAERRDAQGTLVSPGNMGVAPVLRWVLPAPQGFAGGPAVDANGHVYVAANDGVLFSLTADGSVRWQKQLPAAPVGSPALGLLADSPEPLGQSAVYITDQAGGLLAFDLDGVFLWRFQTATGRRASSAPVVGLSGTIYYTVVDRVEAVTPGGVSLWTSPRLPGSGEAAPRLDTAETRLFVQDAVLDVKTGKLLDFNALVVPGTAGINAIYMIGGDGLTYLREAHSVSRWEMTDARPRRVAETSWESRSATIYLPQESAVGSGGWAWLVYGSNYDDLRLVILSMEGRLLGNIFYPQRGSKLIAIDSADRAYVCGFSRGTGPECIAFSPGAEEPVWQVAVPEMGQVNGGALAPGRLYVTTRDGALYAIGDG